VHTQVWFWNVAVTAAMQRNIVAAAFVWLFRAGAVLMWFLSRMACCVFAGVVCTHFVIVLQM
jgi:hypothetical protein